MQGTLSMINQGHSPGEAMLANRHTLPQDSGRRKIDFLVCVHCSFKLVAIYQAPSGKREYSVLPGIQYSVQSALGHVICLKCPSCGHSTVVSNLSPS